MDWSWLNNFSGGVDVLPIFIAAFGLYYLIKPLRRAESVEEKLGWIMAWVAALALIVAQTSWIYAVINEIRMLGSVMDNVWTIVNICATAGPLLLASAKLKND